MVASWVVIGLIFSALAVSVLGAAFSVFGLRDLFSGAALAVILMAASLEFAKFVLAAYLHQRWKVLHGFFRSYLVGAVAVLSLITSMGIFGFLSNAYQSSSATLETEELKLSALKGQMDRHKAEIERLTKVMDEIPANRVTKRLEARKEIEPVITELNKNIAQAAGQIDLANLKILEVKQKVGPLIYISRAFKVNIDDVVKYLILVLVFVFDPLAISLVIATSEALTSRRKEQAPGVVQTTPAVAPAAAASAGAPPVVAPVDGQVVHMRFAAEPNKDEKAV